MDTQYNPSTTQTPVTAPPAEVPVRPLQASSSNSKKSKMILVSVIFAMLFVVLIAAGYYFLVYQNDLSDTQDASAAVFIPEEDEIDYVNNTYGFKMIVKRMWHVSEFGTKVEFKTANNGQIIFDAFDDSEFASISEIDERFCGSFETGFREAIPNKEVAERFSFTLLEQNGLKGCEAEGEMEAGFRQKFNVFYNPTNNYVYTVFYTSSDPASEEELIKSMETFRITD